jgi:MFS family permease
MSALPPTESASPSSSPKIYRAGTLTYTKGTLAILSFWLLWGDFCFVLMEAVVPSIMPLRFKAVGASNTTMGLALTSIPGIINMICNPIISFKSDRFRSRWGRRIPFIFATTPLLVLCVVALGFSETIGTWIHAHLAAYLDGVSPAMVTIITMSALLTGFSFFNTFVNSVFWYLFNDVVPEMLLARFMSWFRVVSLGAGALYSFFIFQYAGTHFKEIFLGAGVLYFFGFGMMIFMVKEGEYPPVPQYVDGDVGPIAAIKTYAVESFAHRHYWFIFLANMGQWGVGTAAMFGLFFNQSMGLTLAQIGDLGGAGLFTGGASILISGWLADKFHPIRIVIAGWIMQVILAPIGLIWLFVHPSPHRLAPWSPSWIRPSSCVSFRAIATDNIVRLIRCAGRSPKSSSDPSPVYTWTH